MSFTVKQKDAVPVASNQSEQIQPKRRSRLWLFIVLALLPIVLICVLLVLYMVNKHSGLLRSFPSLANATSSGQRTTSTRFQQLRTTVSGWSRIQQVGVLSWTVLAVLAVVVLIVYSVYLCSTPTTEETILGTESGTDHYQIEEEEGLDWCRILAIIGTIVLALAVIIIGVFAFVNNRRATRFEPIDGQERDTINGDSIRLGDGGEIDQPFDSLHGTESATKHATAKPVLTADIDTETTTKKDQEPETDIQSVVGKGLFDKVSKQLDHLQAKSHFFKTTYDFSDLSLFSFLLFGGQQGKSSLPISSLLNNVRLMYDRCFPFSPLPLQYFSKPAGHLYSRMETWKVASAVSLFLAPSAEEIAERIFFTIQNYKQNCASLESSFMQPSSKEIAEVLDCDQNELKQILTDHFKKVKERLGSVGALLPWTKIYVKSSWLNVLKADCDLEGFSIFSYPTQECKNIAEKLEKEWKEAEKKMTWNTIEDGPKNDETILQFEIRFKELVSQCRSKIKS